MGVYILLSASAASIYRTNMEFWGSLILYFPQEYFWSVSRGVNGLVGKTCPEDPGQAMPVLPEETHGADQERRPIAADRNQDQPWLNW